MLKDTLNLSLCIQVGSVETFWSLITWNVNCFSIKCSYIVGSCWWRTPETGYRRAPCCYFLSCNTYKLQIWHRWVCSEDRLASDLCIQTHVARHSIYLSEEGAESLCVRKTYVRRDQGWIWKSPHHNSNCRWWRYILPDKWFMISGIKKNHSSLKLSSLKKLIEEL